MPQVKGESKPSDLIACPTCGKMVRRRGLLAHIRLAHPEVDAKSVVRKYIIPTVKGRTLLQAVELPSGEIQFNWLSLTRDEVKVIIEGLKAFQIAQGVEKEIRPLSVELDEDKIYKVPTTDESWQVANDLIKEEKRAKSRGKNPKKDLGFFDW